MPGARSPARRNDLDWLRVAALGLLIVTHVTYLYRTTPWRLQSEHAGLWGDLIVEALAPWRMSLVFFIGGVATRFMLESRDLATFTVNRVLRLGVPFMMAVFVLVPPMWYLTDPLSQGRGYLEYMIHTPLHAHTVFGFHLPDLGHVWFLPYLLTYAMLAALAWTYAPRSWERVETSLASMPILALLAGLALLFASSDAWLKPIFGRTDMLVDDPAAHLRSIPAFLTGAMLARSGDFWSRLQRAGNWLVPLSLILMLGALALAAADTMSAHYLSGWQMGLADGVYGAAALLAILAVASARLTHNSHQLTYASEAIMPIYLLHQPIIVAAGILVTHAGLPVWIEYPLMLATTLLVPLAIYHIAIRPFAPLRMLFGLKMNETDKSAARLTRTPHSNAPSST